MKCEQRGCAEEATAEVFWPGRPTKQCAAHALALLNLANVMCFAVECRPLPLPATRDGAA